MRRRWWKSTTRAVRPAPSESSRLPREESPRDMMECRGLRRPRAKHGIRAVHRASGGCDLGLLNIPPGLMRHVHGRRPATRTTGATRLARSSAGPWTRPAVDQGMLFARVPSDADRAARNQRKGRGMPGGTRSTARTWRQPNSGRGAMAVSTYIYIHTDLLVTQWGH